MVEAESPPVALPSKRHAAKPVTHGARRESAWLLARRHLWSQSRDSRLTPVSPQPTSRPAVKPPAGSPSGNTEAVIGPYPCCDELCKKPTTGITGCCARTDTGHVTAAPGKKPNDLTWPHIPTQAQWTALYPLKSTLIRVKSRIASVANWTRRALKNPSGWTNRASARSRTILAKAASISRLVLALRI